MPNYTQAEVEAGFREMLSGYDLGRNVALDLKPGMYFGGAWGQADLAGISKEDHLRRVGFTQGSLDGIKIAFPDGVRVDANGIIVG